jgi:hypothetical protein
VRRLAATFSALTAALPTLLAVTLSAGVVAAVSPASAPARSGDIYSQIRLAYERNGAIPTCEFTSSQLTTALNALDAYGLEYFADFIAAIQNALTLRAAGACSRSTGHVSSARAPIPPAASLPSSLTAATSSGAPAPILLLAGLAAVLALMAAAVGLTRERRWGRAWPASWRHGAAEARYQAEGLWDGLVARRRR